MRMTLLFLLLSLGSCQLESAPQKPLQTSNPGYSVDQLFTDNNGVTIYRFYDMGDYRYYLHGPNGAQMLPTIERVTETVTETVYVEKPARK